MGIRLEGGRQVGFCLASIIVVAWVTSVAGSELAVTVLRTPRGGIQPQAVAAPDGTVHLLWFRGEPAGGDLEYARLEPGRDDVATPVRVNSQPGSAIAIGTIRGGQLALGRGGRVHVAWNGAQGARPANPIEGSPMLYARSNTRGEAFEPQRNLMRRTSGLDGGGTVAADAEGTVYVAWHGRGADAPRGEAGRAPWVARSTDDGATFAAEVRALDQPTGACGCCGTRALVDGRGTLYLLFRAATDSVGRDMFLVTSRDRGVHFEGRPIHPWKVNACPMSSETMATGPDGVVAAWETEGQVYFAGIDRQTRHVAQPVSPPGGGGNRKHPAVAVNPRGEVLLAWAEGTGWQRGGTLRWMVFDPSGRPTRRRGKVEGGIPVWSLPAVAARADGSFLIIH